MTPLLEIDDLHVSFGSTRAVCGMRLSIHERQTLAVVGESGCGKSVTAMSILGVLPTATIERGSIRYRLGDDTIDLASCSPAELRRLRGEEIAMIFQEPMTSLNPVYSVGDQIIEAIRLHRDVSRREARTIAIRAMDDVGIPNASSRMKAYPHEFSGGMRQRVMIAMALSCQPRLLLADEPTTALDVTIQAQILDLMGRLKRDRGLAIMLITHDLGVVAQHADVVAVVYAGRVVEYAEVHDLYNHPLHPYTRGLLSSIPDMAAPTERLVTVAETLEAPGAFDPIEGRTPWWPGRHDTSYALHEVRASHWVGVCSDEPSAVPRLQSQRTMPEPADGSPCAP
ncbi:MAG: ABC transporter ATP-binding protein [Phycisphaerales bacterium]|nr:ABC transporter ATP-binding protein [Phycisphaerales bacterium]